MRLIGVAAPAAAPTAGGEIPLRPEALRFAPLVPEVPDPGPLRHLVAGGAPVYVLEDHALPLVNVTVQLRAGAFLDPPGQDGLAALTATLVRLGGTAQHPAAELEESIGALAARLGSSADDGFATVSLDCLSSRLDESLDLLFEMLAKPAFDAAPLEAEKRRMVSVMATRNDDPLRILDREWRWLLYGRGHVVARYPTAPEIAPIARQDLVAFHARYWVPANMVLAVSGDVDTRAVLARLAARFAAFEGRGRPAPWPPPLPRHRPVPGLYSVDVASPQAQVAIGHLGLAWNGHWNDRGRYAASVAQQVLGGGGFASRLMRRLRTETGLVYGVSSALDIGVLWPEPFEIRFAADPANAGRAVTLALEEVRRLRDTRVSDEELETAKNLLLMQLADTFGSARKTAATLALDETLGRPHASWRDARDHLLAVTAEEVQAAAQQVLRPEEALVLVVGSWSRVAAAGALPPLSHHPLPLRDPLTLPPAP